MHSTAKKLRFHTKDLLESVARGEEVVITYRGKPRAKLVPLKNNAGESHTENALFGIWSDRSDLADVDLFVREKRKGRFQ